MLGCDQTQAFDHIAHSVGVVVIGHGAERGERQQLVSLLQAKLPQTTIANSQTGAKSLN